MTPLETPLETALEIFKTKAALARAIGAKPMDVQHWFRGRPIPIKYCPAIEAATEGAVTRHDLRPDDWHLIWPELADPSSADVA